MNCSTVGSARKASITNRLEFIWLSLFRASMCSQGQSFPTVPLPAGSCTEVQTLAVPTQPEGRQAQHLLNSVGAVPACFKGKLYPVFIPAYKAWKGLGGQTSTTVISGRIKQNSNSWAEWASPCLITNGFGNKQKREQSQWKTSLFLSGSCSGCVETAA